MVKNRCANDIFSYCAGEPKETTKTEEWNVTPDVSNRNIRTKTIRACKLDKETCGYHTTIMDIVYPG